VFQYSLFRITPVCSHSAVEVFLIQDMFRAIFFVLFYCSLDSQILLLFTGYDCLHLFAALVTLQALFINTFPVHCHFGFYFLCSRHCYIFFILLSLCIFTNSIYFTPTNAHVKPLFLAFIVKCTPTCVSILGSSSGFFFLKKPLSLQLHVLKGPIALMS
jgi:hypothetical protein